MHNKKNNNELAVLIFAMINDAHICDFIPLTVQFLPVGHSFTLMCKNTYFFFLLSTAHGALSKWDLLHQPKAGGLGSTVRVKIKLT